MRVSSTSFEINRTTYVLKPDVFICYSDRNLRALFDVFSNPLPIYSKIMGMNLVEFSDGVFLFWMPEGTMHVLSADLFLQASSRF
jgi:hypothetical protein